MYLIPYAMIQRFLANRFSGDKAMAEPSSIMIPLPLFRRLLQQTLEKQPFDEIAYLDANPDVASAVRRGEIESGHKHYVQDGYFEGRAGGPDMFDEAWYFRTNADVSRSVRAGLYPSGKVHFHSAGVQEFRAPTAAAETDMRLWKGMLSSASAEVREAAE